MINERETEGNLHSFPCCPRVDCLFRGHLECALIDLHEFAQEVALHKNGLFPNEFEQIALIHSEVSEIMEALRMSEVPMSEKIPGFTLVEEEIADSILRLLHLAVHTGSRVEAAMRAKYSYNLTRPYKHGGKRI